MIEKNNILKSKKFVYILIIIIILLSSILIYSLIIKPSYNEKIDNAYQQGAIDMISQILTQISQRGEININTDSGIITLIRKEIIT